MPKNYQRPKNVSIFSNPFNDCTSLSSEEYQHVIDNLLNACTHVVCTPKRLIEGILYTFNDGSWIFHNLDNGKLAVDMPESKSALLFEPQNSH